MNLHAKIEILFFGLFNEYVQGGKMKRKMFVIQPKLSILNDLMIFKTINGDL